MERGREPPEHAVRADRILAAASELLLRQVTEVTREQVAGMRADPTEVLLHRVTSVSFQAIMQRPLARALYTRDLDALGKLAASDTAGVAARQQVAGALFDEYVDLMRAHGLLRTDIDRQTQRYVLNAVGTGFFVTEQFLPEQPQEISLEHKTAALAEVIRLAVEAPGEPDPDILRAVAPRAIECSIGCASNATRPQPHQHSNHRSNDDHRAAQHTADHPRRWSHPAALAARDAR